MNNIKYTSLLAGLSFVLLAGSAVSAAAQNKGIKDKALAPASKFDLSHWNITLPADFNRDGKVDSISVKDLKKAIPGVNCAICSEARIRKSKRIPRKIILL